MNTIPNCVPEIAGNETRYLKECVDTGWLSPVGPFVDRFEKEFAAYHGVAGAVAVASGTAAIHLGLLALGVKPGDCVLVPSLTFVASVNPIRYCGAEPVFLGSEPETLNLDPAVLDEYLAHGTRADADDLYDKATGRRIAALVVVHLYGTPASMDRIMAIAAKHRLPVLEDAAESPCSQTSRSKPGSRT